MEHLYLPGKCLTVLLLFFTGFITANNKVNGALLTNNLNTTIVAAPVITTQPASQVACTGAQASVTFTVVASGAESYQWKKNGVAIDGATLASYTIAAVETSHIGAYSVAVTNSSGTVQSSTAYLNSVITQQPQSINTCQFNAVNLSVTASGTSLSYQWYVNTTNSTSGGSAIATANYATYTPSVSTVGTKYYYAVIKNNGQECTATTTNVVAVTVATAASVSAPSPNQTICPNNAAVISVSWANGTLQWHQSDNGTSGWMPVTGGYAVNSTTYVTGSLTSTTYYRAFVTNGNCTTTSTVISITVAESYIWTGAVSADWNHPGNWSCGTVPTSAQNVIITSQAANQPEIAEITAYAKSISLGQGASLNILSTGTLQLINEVTVAEGGVLTVQNNGSLLQQNSVANTGKIVVKKDSNLLYRLDYTMWSSPVAGQLLKTFSPFTSTSRFYTYGGLDTGNVYQDQYFVVPNINTATFSPATGYLIRMPNSVTGGPTGSYYMGEAPMVFKGNFIGTPNNGTIYKDLQTQGNRYTAVGNPYPSPISVSEFFTQNSGVLDGLSGMYFWRKKNDMAVSTYATLTLAGFVANGATPKDEQEDEEDEVPTPGYAFGGQDQNIYFSGEGNDNTNWLIAPGQGFIVQTKQGITNPQAVFNSSMRKPATITGSVAFLKGAPQQETSVSRVWINLSSANSFSQTAIVYMDGATTGLDYGYDGRKFINGNSTLYSVALNETLAIQARPVFNAADVVALGYTVENYGSYKLSLDHFEGVFANGQNVYLKDNFLGTTHNLTDADYTFIAAPGIFNERFEILYAQPLSTGNPLLNANSVVVYKEGNAIKIATGNIDMNAVTVYDITGRRLYNQQNINATQTAITNLAAQQEVLIIEIDTAQGKVSKKIVY